MTVPTGTPGDEVPEADWAEQAAETGPLAEGHPPAGVGVASSREADEADLAEQEQTVNLDDEER